MHPGSPVGAGLPAMTACQLERMLDVPASSRASPLPQGLRMYAVSAGGQSHCGSWLASDGVVSVGEDVGRAGLIAGKPAPTGFAECTQYLRVAKVIVGAGLPAIALCQFERMLDVPASSRASPLLQLIVVIVRSRATYGSCRNNPRTPAPPSAPGRTGRTRNAGTTRSQRHSRP